MLKALIFDCDGVIADTEPLHFAALQQVLAEHHISLTRTLYDSEYLAYDDRGCFLKAFAAQSLTQDQLDQLIARKAALFEPLMADHARLFPGVAELVRSAAAHYPLAIASGARRAEIEAILALDNLHSCFPIIISTEDVSQSKPHPEAFLRAFAALNERAASPLSPANCLVIEDSLHGVAAARAAGMRCLAVTNSYAREQLAAADLVVDTLQDLSLAQLERAFLRGSRE